MKIIKEISLLNCPKKMYTSAIFKNNHYILSLPICKQIVVMDYLLNIINKIETCSKYTLITYGKKYNEYFAIKENDNTNIYVLDICFNELYKIPLKLNKKYIQEIISLTFDCEKCSIIIAQKDKIFSVTIDGDFIKELLTQDTINKIANSETKNIKYQTLNGCCCYKQVPVKSIYITAITCFCCELYIAYFKNNSAYISKISPNGNIIDTYYIGENIKINSMFNSCGALSLLVTKQDCYNYIYITSLCCESYCEIIDCNECRVDCECDKKHCHNCCDDIICSIACMEKGLACILNNEGHKIQTAIKKAQSVDDLIKVNDSVTKTVNEVTLLEQVLYNKLKTAICCNEKK